MNNFCLRINNNTDSAPCGLCDGPTDHYGLDVFVTVEGMLQPACDGCAEKHAPELLVAREAWEAFKAEQALYDAIEQAESGMRV